MKYTGLMLAMILWCTWGHAQEYRDHDTVPPPGVPVVSDKVFQLVEQMPEFEGGESALMKFIRQNVNYPGDAREMNIQGRVVAGFVIRADGSLDSVRVLKRIWPSIDKEALRVVRLTAGHWKPGSQQGKPVAVHFVLPLMMRLDEDDFTLLDYPTSSEDERAAHKAYAKGNYKGALKLYRAISGKHPDDKMVQHNLSICLYKTGDKEAACKIWNDLRDQDWHTTDYLLGKYCR